MKLDRHFEPFDRGLWCSKRRVGALWAEARGKTERVVVLQMAGSGRLSVDRAERNCITPPDSRLSLFGEHSKALGAESSRHSASDTRCWSHEPSHSWIHSPRVALSRGFGCD
jgi:hypothetical protein